MRVRIVLDVDLASGDYEVTVRNLSQPGEGVDLDWLQRVLLKVNAHWAAQARAGAAQTAN